MRKLILAIVFPVLLVATGCGVSSPPRTGPDDRIATSPRVSSSEESANPGECEYVQTDNASRPVDLPPMQNVEHTGTATFTINTNEGPVKITMDREKTPCTINSFESLVQQKFYDDTSCHRLSDSGLFMLQCGDPTGTGSGGPGYSFADETTPDMTYPAGTVAMANSGEDTNGSQFFLVYEDSQLPPNYTVFGTMDADSIGVVARIAAEGQNGAYPDGSGKPNNPAHIETVTPA
ncbi:peptidylprolyl isomerase [Microlunatus sp. Y2014]|uniref:peptidylprolyl isomerase n=1 Tax=Microlunatus sp. Y2014 TaxID=3418488 RepID=UPI003DA739E0